MRFLFFFKFYSQRLLHLCFESRRGIYDLISWVTGEVLSNDASSTCVVFARNCAEKLSAGSVVSQL